LHVLGRRERPRAWLPALRRPARVPPGVRLPAARPRRAALGRASLAGRSVRRGSVRPRL